MTIHYGCWNSGYGTSYVVEGVASGNLHSTSAATYTFEVKVTDGVLDVAINRGAQSYGGYINGLDVVPVVIEPEAVMTYSEGSVTVTSESVTKAILIHVSDQGIVTIKPLSFADGEATADITVKSGDKLMVWNSITGMVPLSEVYE